MCDFFFSLRRSNGRGRVQIFFLVRQSSLQSCFVGKDMCVVLDKFEFVKAFLSFCLFVSACFNHCFDSWLIFFFIQSP